MAISRLAILAAIVVLPALLGSSAAAQPGRLTLGIYAPTVEFDTAQARLAYVQGLARVIEQATGIETNAQAYATFAALQKDAVDFAIIDAPCYATNLSWKLLATAKIGGNTARTWALYASAGNSMRALRGKKLAYIAMGCNDSGFVDHAMLDSEVDAGFFGARVSAKDLTGAIASVTSYRTAHAVFAPVGSTKGLIRIFETGSVPNPAFVAVSAKIPATLAYKVATAVIAYGSSGEIAGWARATREPYQAFAARLLPNRKAGLFATPEVPRISKEHVVIDPPTLDTPALVGVRQHFVRTHGARMR